MTHGDVVLDWIAAFRNQFDFVNPAAQLEDRSGALVLVPEADICPVRPVHFGMVFFSWRNVLAFSSPPPLPRIKTREPRGNRRPTPLGYTI
jgi:hypothetical protein